MEHALVNLERDIDLVCQEIFNSGCYDDILYFLYSSESISLDVYRDFLDDSISAMNKIQRLIRYVCDNTHLIGDFLRALQREGLHHLLNRVNPTVDNAFCDPSHEFGDRMQRLPYVPPSASFPSLSTVPHMIPPSGSSSYPEALNERPAVPLDIKVIKSHAVFGNDSANEEVYKNSTLPRGKVFIANYQTFENNHHQERRGSEVDVRNLCKLFNQMGYSVTDPKIDLTKAETLKALRIFRDDPTLSNVDSCVVVIMSHGYDDRSFCTYDRHLSDSEVLELFNNIQCPLLKKKPKIFIFQYCRGHTRDIGVEQFPTEVSYERYSATELETDAAAKGITIPLTNLTTNSDFFIIYATYPGYVSFRNPITGSWLIEAICQVFMNHAYCEDLESLMKRVSRQVKNWNSDQGRKQVVEWRIVGFDKHFYFNPIGCEDLGTFNFSNMNENLPHPDSSLVRSLPSFPLPHQLRPIRHEIRSRCSTPEAYEMSHSNSAPRLYELSHSNSYNRIRHGSGLSTTSESGLEFEEKKSSRRRADSRSSNAESLSEACSPDENLTADNGGEDIVDYPSHSSLKPPTGQHIPGSAEHFRKFRLERISQKQQERPESPSHFKRQLSIPSDKEILVKLNDVQQYFTINNRDELAKDIEPFKDEVIKNKQKCKRKKKDLQATCSSLEY